ncbi:hypothetical protein COCSUDRAFT_16269, partial [Coccomyxa subellipsoidea C-169]
QILFNISGTCQPGEVLALMGPSGSGKTTLLSILGGRAPTALTMKGWPSFNGEKLTKRAKRQVGFVLQDDLLYETLTVFETLYYAAMLRLPSTMTSAQKCERVENVILSLGLDKCRDTIVGGFFRRGISGGERKRVSVGHELLINPSIILLDEPTSGLDSTTAMNLVTTLCQLAAGGRAVITTIHQPSSRLYQQLDKLLLLSDGHAMYYAGNAGLAAEWFKTLGFTMPYGVNMADFILDVASGAVISPKLDPEQAQAHLIEAALRKVADVSCMRLCQAGSAGAAKGKLQPARRWGASYWTQIHILFARAVKTRRFESLSSQDFAQFVIVGVLSGLFWWQQGRGDTVLSAQNSNGLLFFEMLFLAFRSMFVALFTFPSEFKMMLKERASGMYRLSAFYFARTASDLPMELTTPSLFIFIIYFMGGLRLTAGAFFGNWLGTMLVTLVAQSFGLLIGATVMEAKTAQTVTAVIMLTMMLVGGFYVTTIPVWIAWLKYLSFIYYGYNLLLKIEYNWLWELLVLFGWLVFFRFLIYVALRFKTAAPQAKSIF